MGVSGMFDKGRDRRDVCSTIEVEAKGWEKAAASEQFFERRVTQKREGCGYYLSAEAEEGKQGTSSADGRFRWTEVPERWGGIQRGTNAGCHTL